MTGTAILAHDQVSVDWHKDSNLEVLDIVSAHGSQGELAIEMVARAADAR